MKRFKEGDRVFDLFNGGWGVITRIDTSLQWQIIVCFDNGKIGMYLLDGKDFICNDIPRLYHQEYSLDFKK